jgi:signal transduction histidine kinase
MPLSLVLNLTINLSVLGIAFFIGLYLSHDTIKKIDIANQKTKHRIEKEYEQSIQNIYDEHIFAITHELRSPLAVVASATFNILNDSRNLYNLIKPNASEEITARFKNVKRNTQSIQNQVEIIENFISLISEHASYVGDEGKTEKIIHMYSYLISVLMNAPSYSMNMRIFNKNIKFGDNTGGGFEGIQVVVNPHDLSRIIMNICTNAADAVVSSYKIKKDAEPDYNPTLYFNCLKAEQNETIRLDPLFKCIGKKTQEEYPFYLIVSDNGPGVSTENIDKIFKKGFSTKRHTNSTHHGLGLHITLQLAKRNNLAIFLKTSDTGTEFAIAFPNIISDEKYWKAPGTSSALFQKLLDKPKDDEYLMTSQSQIFPDEDSDSCSSSLSTSRFKL